MTAPRSAIAELYSAIADDIEGRDYPTYRAFRVGPEVWTSAYQAAATLLVHPAMEGLRRHLKLAEVQQWDADKPTALAALRHLADAEQQPLREAADTRRILNAGQALRAGLGVADNDDSSLAQLADWAGRKLVRLEREAESLRDEVKRLKAAAS